MILRGNVYSQRLEMNTGITVIIPNKFKQKKPHKVVYLLHGIHGDNDTWLEFTKVALYARDKDVIFVMPSVQRSFYSDMKFGQKFYSYVAEELPEIAENTFNISSKPEDTAVIGCSMGGYGALKIGLSRPDKFGFVAGFSSALLPIKEYHENCRTEEQKKAQSALWGSQMVKDMEAIFGEDMSYKESDDIFELAKLTEKSPHNPSVYMACGFKDYLYKDNNDFQKKMKELDIDFCYEEWEGEHDWTFFDEALEKSLAKFLA